MVVTKKTALQIAEDPACKVLVAVRGAVDDVLRRMGDVGLDARLSS